MPDAHDPLRAARSHVLDAYAQLESAMSDALAATAKPCPPGSTMGQKIKHLKDNTKGQPLPADFAQQLEQLLAVRNDIVHSVVRFTNMKGGSVAIYTNAASNSVVPSSRIANLETHQKIVKVVLEAKSRLAA